MSRSKRDVVAVYDPWEHLDEKREALNKWAAHVEALIAANAKQEVKRRPQTALAPLRGFI
jgi:hypothetical protein